VEQGVDAGLEFLGLHRGVIQDPVAAV
jgi:hypothetical protein